jgi:hypothetical protein
MQTTGSTARRTVVRVEDKIHFGADSQVDDRNVLITPMNPALTDPFLLLSSPRPGLSGTRTAAWRPSPSSSTACSSTATTWATPAR